MGRPKQAVCNSGHRMIGENLYIRPDNGQRQCRECRREIARRKRDAEGVQMTKGSGKPVESSSPVVYPPEQRSGGIAEIPDGPECPVCEKGLMMYLGKWICRTTGCSMEGQEQKGMS